MNRLVKNSKHITAITSPCTQTSHLPLAIIVKNAKIAYLHQKYLTTVHEPFVFYKLLVSQIYTLIS